MKPEFLLLISVLLFSTLALGQNATSRKSATAHKSKSQPKTAHQANTPEAIHQSAIIIDTHADTPQRFLDENFDLGETTPVTEGQIDLGKIKKGNLGAEFFSIWVEPEFKGQYAKRAMDLIDSVYRRAARHLTR